MEFLKKIATLTSERLQESQKRIPAAALKDQELFSRAPLRVLPAFRNKGYNVIAEIKFASPSEGMLRDNADAEAVAGAYLRAGAAMLSVLTEPLYFKGDLAYLAAIRRQNPEALLLRKDFIVDAYQLLEARAHGADAVLLIVAMTGPALTKELLLQARLLGLTPLVEVHDEDELETAASIGADFIGVNNRNLKTLKISLETSRRLAPLKPENAVFICESGLSRAADLQEMRALGYDGFLMGTAFMRQNDPGAALRRLQKELS